MQKVIVVVDDKILSTIKCDADCQSGVMMNCWMSVYFDQFVAKIESTWFYPVKSEDVALLLGI